LVGRVFPVQENIFLSWLVTSVQYKRIFSCFGWSHLFSAREYSFLSWLRLSSTREYFFLLWLVSSVQCKIIFFFLARLVCPVQENIFLLWLVSFVQYTRIFSSLANISLDFSQSPSKQEWAGSRAMPPVS
jgi:hypothetical protein